jgi:AAA15 family ATPase/GTPase
MIEDIEITNFRCFDRLKVSGCKRINLISGKNNVGKTALLEAIRINSTPKRDTILSISNLRGESNKILHETPEQFWENLFCKSEIIDPFCIRTNFSNKSYKEVSILKQQGDVFFGNIKTKILNGLPEDLSDQLSETYEKWLTRENFSDYDTNNIIVILVILPDEHFVRLISLTTNHEISLNAYFDKSIDREYIQNSLFVPSTLRASGIELTTEFDKARLNDRDDEVVRAFQIIDPSIVAVESFSIPEPTIYLKRQGEKRMPLPLFGDAMNRMADIILKIINNQDSILLIDEIENGIHHSSQIAFWDFLYRLADRLNVQIFATTHSLEMTEAFIKAGLDRPDSAAHFELTRHEKTQKIVAINRDLETLEYGISHHKEVRGGS